MLSAHLELNNCSLWHTLPHNAAAVGGMIYAEEPASASVQASGGSNSATLLGASVTLNDTLVHGGRAAEGGAVYAINANVKAVASVFMHSQATEFGGCVSAAAGSVVDVRGTSLNHCTAAFDGGAVFVSEASLLMNRSSILHSTADQGGGVYVATFGQAMIEDSTVALSAAGSIGGGVYVHRLGSLAMKHSRLTRTFTPNRCATQS